MEPVTHLLASYTLARAARTRVFSPRMAVFLCAGTACDLDWFFRLPPPVSALRAYGTAAHSLVGAGALAGAIGLAGWAAARKNHRQKTPLGTTLAAAFAAAAVHLLLDLSSNTGIELFWPLRGMRVAWNLAGNFEGILLSVLAACALLPGLFSLVTEEIGAQTDTRPGRGWPLAALSLVVLDLGLRAFLHGRAEDLLGAARFQDATPRRWAAYPAGLSPFTWRGVAETDSSLVEVEVPVALGGAFDPQRASIRFKPEASPALDAAAATSLARAYTALARFPAASVEQGAEGMHVELRELGDSLLHTSGGTWLASIDLDAQTKVTHQELYWMPSRSQ